MGNVFSFLNAQLICSYIKIPVDLHGIAVDDFSPHKFSDLEGGGALPYSGRSQDDDKAFLFSFQF
jgi:hypothetical protein